MADQWGTYILESDKAVEIVAGLNCGMTTERADT